MKFDGASWVQVGTAGFSAGGTEYTSLVLGSTDTPYVAYRDYVNSSEASVQKFSYDINGFIQATITPQDAAAAGAQWCVNGTCYNSGAKIGFSPGTYTVEYSTLPCWKKPANQIVTVTSAQTSTATVTYLLNTYSINASSDSNGTISPSGNTSVNCGVNQTFTVTPYACYEVDKVLADNAAVTLTDGKYTFTNVTSAHSISVTFKQKSSIITASAGTGGTISPSGNVSVNCGANQTFTVTPNACYEIDKVLADNVAVTLTDGKYTFTNVTSAHSISVTFKQKSSTVTASAGTGGTISPSGSVSVNCGANQVFTVTPNNCYDVDKVLVDNSPVTLTDGKYTFANVTANHSISVTFKQKNSTVTASAGTGGTISPSGSVSVNCGANQIFTVTPAACYEVDKVLVDNSAVTLTDGKYTFANVTANHSINVTFKQKSSTVTASAGTGGTISPSGNVSVNCGANQVFTVTPNSCYDVDKVLVDNSAVTLTDGKYTFANITANHSISVTFKQKSSTVTASAGTGGTISPSGNVSVNCGANQTFTVTPNSCHDVDKVLVDNSAVTLTDGKYNFANVTANHSISVTFKQKNSTVTASAGTGGTITPSGNVSVSCGVNQIFTVTPDSCYDVDKVLVDNSAVTLTDGKYNFANVTANHSISVTFKQKNSTVTASAGTGGTISPSGSFSVNCGSNQIFTVTPDSCYDVDKVLVDNSAVILTDGKYTFANVTANHSISVTFKQKISTVTASAGTGGTISPSGNVSVNCGANQVFTVTPNTCYDVDKVLADNSAVTLTDGKYTFTNVTANHSISVTFKQKSSTVTASAGTGGTISPSGNVSVNCGANQVFTVTPNTCYDVDKVLADNSAVTLTDGKYTFTNVTANHSISVTFKQKNSTVTASAGTGGTISPSGSVSVNCGVNQTFTVTPAACYDVDKVLVDNSAVTLTDGKYTFTNVTTNHSISVTFKQKISTVTASAGSGGTITPSGNVSVNCGANQVFTVTPNACYDVDKVLVDNSAVTLTDGKYTFTNVTANHSISVTFKQKSSTVTASAGTGGTVNPSGNVSVNCGANQIFTVTPNACYEVDKVLVDNAAVTLTDGKYTFTNVTANHSISVTFKQKSSTVTASAGTGGTVNPSGNVSVNCGANQIFTVTPNACYEVDKVLVDNAAVTLTDGKYTFSNVTSNHSISVTFKQKTSSLTINSTNGTVTKNPDKSSYNCGEKVTLTANPNSCYEFTGFSGACSGASCTLTMDSNKSVTANFGLKTYSLNITAVNGTVTKNPDKASYDCGTSVTLTAVPNSGYHFDRWEGTDSASGSSATVVMNNDRNIKAIFAQSVTSFRIWIDKNGSGSYDSGEGIQGATVFVNTETAKRGTTDSNGVITLQNIKNEDKIYAYKQLFGADNIKAGDTNFGTRSKNPYYASNSTDAVNGKMYYFVMASDIMANEGKYHDFPGQNKTLQNVVKDSTGNILVQLVHPRIEWNYVVAFEEGQSDDFYIKVKTGFKNYADYMYNYSDGYSVVRNVVFVKGAYKDTAQWDYCDVQITNSEWPRAVVFGNRYNGKSPLIMRKYFNGTNDYTAGPPDTYNWYSTLGHESGHYLLGFFDEYLNGNAKKKKSDGTWLYRIDRDGDSGEPNEFPKNYGLMEHQYSSHEISDVTDYFPRVYSPIMDDDLVTHQFKIREGKSCWAYFKYFYQNDIKSQMQKNGLTDYSDSFFNNLIIPPHTAGSYPGSDSTKRPEPSAMNHNTVNFIDWTMPSSRSKAEKVYDALVYVLDEDGNPISDADVWLVSDERKSFQSKTDRYGVAKTGSIAIGKRLEAYSKGIKAELEISEIKESYLITLQTEVSHKRRESDIPGIVVSAEPYNSDSKEVSVMISGDALIAAPSVVLSQSHSYTDTPLVISSGDNRYTAIAKYEYYSGNFSVAAKSGTGSSESENPFEIYGTDIGPASGYYAPHGELEMTYTSDSFEGSGTFVMLNSTGTAPANGSLKQIGHVFSIGFSESVKSVRNVGFNIPLSDSELEGVDSSNLNLYGWDAENSRWILISGGTNNLKFFSIALDTLDYVSYALFAPSIADTTPPSEITDLKASTGDSRWSIILEWRSPSDNGKAAFAYDIRFNTVPITDSNWNESISAGYVPLPEAPGTVQTMTVEMPDPDKVYYFAIRSANAAGNLSSVSSSSKAGSTIIKGDFNCNYEIDLTDAIIALQLQVSINAPEPFCFSDITGDNKTGMEEVIYILQHIADMR